MGGLSFGQFQGPGFVRRDERGLFAEIVNTGVWKSLAYCEMNTGAVMGGHYHRYTVVLLYFLEGKGSIKTVNVETGDVYEYTLATHCGFIFRPEEARVITFLEDSRILLMKSHRYDPDKPDMVKYTVS